MSSGTITITCLLWPISLKTYLTLAGQCSSENKAIIELTMEVYKRRITHLIVFKTTTQLGIPH